MILDACLWLLANYMKNAFLIEAVNSSEIR
jgi:hypothetical protein